MDGHIRLTIIALILLASCSEAAVRRKRIVGGTAAAKPPEDDPVVFITKGNRDARISGSRDPHKGYYVFRGIRFGEPPVGRQRFQRPKVTHPEGEINATKWGPPCPQPALDGSENIIGSEDCLFLNVFTPALPDAKDGYPVLIWIHGGGFRRGSACQYEMRHLVPKKLIVVSIQYRLGSLGFLSKGTRELPGNNGLFDMILAVNWVKDYIQFFGGNPNQIIPFGHGSGASSAFMLSLSNLSSSHFSGLIALSGSILSHFAIDKNPLETAKIIAQQNNCPHNDTVEMIRCLQQVPLKRLIQADSRLENLRSRAQGFISGISNLLGPGPVIDGKDDGRSLPNFLMESSEDFLRFGDFPNIPLLTGVMKDEAGGAIFGKYKTEVEGKLKTVPNFLTEQLAPSLQGTIPKFSGRSSFVPQTIKNYLNVFGSNDNTIKKVADAMDDSIFNAPTFLTTEYWTKKSKAFLYSFDYTGGRNYGKDFLAGLPIADAKNASSGAASHGDDLGYLFDCNTITGKTLHAAKWSSNTSDDRVIDVFTDLISNFARTGDPQVSTTSDGAESTQIVPKFSSDNSPFISITPSPQLKTNFRYCEMGLWTGLSDRLQSPACSVFRSTFGTVREVGNRAMEPANVLTDVIPNVSRRPQTNREEQNGGILPSIPNIPIRLG